MDWIILATYIFMKTSGITRKVAAKLGGYDIFISYRHLEAEAYAESLHRILEKERLIVFRDESEKDNLGTSTEEFAKLACSARCLVTIVTADVYESENVYDELSAYLANRIDKWYRRPFSRIISINIGQALSMASSKKQNWGRLSNFVYEPETQEALQSGVPSSDVVSKLTGAGSFMNSWRRFLIAILLSLLLLIVVGAITLVYLKSLRNDITSTKTSLNTISDSTKRLSKTNKSLVTKAHILQIHTDSLTVQSKVLQKRSDSLDGKGKMLGIRIAAMNQLPYDPLIAYRLAQQAYTLSPDHENRKLLMASLSKIDMYYKSLLAGYVIEGVNEHFTLLSRADKKGEKIFFVLNTNNMKIAPIHVRAAEGWIIPVVKSWRFLAETWEGTGSDAIACFQLYHEAGKPYFLSGQFL